MKLQANLPLDPNTSLFLCLCVPLTSLTYSYHLGTLTSWHDQTPIYLGHQNYRNLVEVEVVYFMQILLLSVWSNCVAVMTFEVNGKEQWTLIWRSGFDSPLLHMHLLGNPRPTSSGTAVLSTTVLFRALASLTSQDVFVGKGREGDFKPH